MRPDVMNSLMASLLLLCASLLHAQERPDLERAWSADDVEWADPITTRLSLYSAEPGQLMLLDAEYTMLQQKQNRPLWLVHVWQMENAKNLADALFHIRFTPDEGVPFQRMLRVTPGTDVRFVLTREQGTWLWQSLAAIPDEIRQLASSTSDEPKAYSWMDVESLDQDITAFMRQLDAAGVTAPDPADPAAALKERGFALLGEGHYAEALLVLKESQALNPTTELTDRIERLERYLDLQGQ